MEMDKGQYFIGRCHLRRFTTELNPNLYSYKNSQPHQHYGFEKTSTAHLCVAGGIETMHFYRKICKVIASYDGGYNLFELNKMETLRMWRG